MPKRHSNGSLDTEVRGHQHADAAAFLATEEARTGAGWASKRPETSIPREPFDLGMPTEFAAKSLGAVTGPRRDPQQLIDHIDSAKRLGNVAWRSTSTDSVIVSLARHGVKVMDARRMRVFLRVPMHALKSVFYYVEDSSECKVVLEVGESSVQDFKYFIYEVKTEAEGSKLCAAFEHAFETVFAQATLESL
eukprot:m.80333 g.80333  ORF g.80333 m.80333 type:complete len:192 (-) comp14659_c1_seq2:34-609(-)